MVELFQRMVAVPNSSGLTLRRKRLLLGIAATLSLTSVSQNAIAFTSYNVTACDDSGVAGTLRSVVGQVNAHPDPNGNLIAMDACVNSTISLQSGAITITADDVGIAVATVPAAGKVTIRGKGHDRVFYHTGMQTLSLGYLAIYDGAFDNPANIASGGCIDSKGSVLISHSTVSGCTVYSTIAAGGGCLYAANTASVQNSTITNCSASANGPTTRVYGGGIATNNGISLKRSVISESAVSVRGWSTENVDTFYSAQGGGVWTAGDLSVSYTTFHGNTASNVTLGGYTAGYGGAIVNRGPSSIIENSTIDNNTGPKGGAIWVHTLPAAHTSLTIVNTTLSGNAAPKGSVIFSPDASAQLTITSCTVAFNSGKFSTVDSSSSTTVNSTIIANNIGTDDLLTELPPVGANNWVGAIAPSGAAPPAGFGVNAADPRLTPLSNHGGLTRVHALLDVSPAVGNGSNQNPLEYDQRGVGFPRATDHLGLLRTDVGAYQRQLIDDEIFYDGFSTPAGD